ncbi:MAG: ribonuclease R [Clostridia bacterium]|nr:ribonuclease R [Clostridia bacterium]
MDISEFLYQYGYSKDFNLAVCEEIKNIPDVIPNEEIKKRKCLFDEKIVTIDGDDSKDFDDAVSIKKFKNGKFELGVHIADVSYYVKENSALDEEAFNRGTSLYLVDNVVPMLPEKLSNNICSLNPESPRLTLSCIMKIDSAGNVEKYDICETVIKSSARMTYRKVTEILEGNMSARNKYSGFIDMFENMRELALILRDKRMKRGAIDFDFPEPYIVVDENGKAIDVKIREMTISNKIIEEFMLLANETIAKHCSDFNIPCVYRVHEEPENEKIQRLSSYAGTFGYKLKTKGKATPKQLQKLLFCSYGNDNQTILSTLILRTMMKARYSEYNLGHFGLAADYYCHFTSPIRRYPDLVVHRILKEWIHGSLDEWRLTHYNRFTVRAAKQSSETEESVASAEMDYDKYKLCEYMEDKIGQEFIGFISSVTDFGFFVQLSNTVEGLVGMKDLTDDYYEFDEDNLLLFGIRTGRIFRIGQKIKVCLSKVNTQLKQIDFVLSEFTENKSDKEVKQKGVKSKKRCKHGKKSRKKKYRSK